jgi:hypothetical protein
MPSNVSLPAPKIGPTTQFCQVCGQSVYCGSTFCPSSSLPVGYDGVTQLSTAYISVTVRGANAVSVTPAAG